MKLNSSSKRSNLLPAITEKWAVQLRKNYGSDQRMLKCWSPDSRSYCTANMRKAAHSASVVRMMKTYPEAFPIALGNVIARTVLDMADEDGQTITAEDVQHVADMILADDRLRTLPTGILWAFFHRAACRRYPIYGKYATPNKLLGTLQTQYTALQAEAAAEREAAELEAKAAAEREAAKNAMSWEEYSQRNGIEGESPLGKI